MLQGLPFIELREHSERPSGSPRAFIVDELELTPEQTVALRAGVFSLMSKERELQLLS